MRRLLPILLAAALGLCGCTPKETDPRPVLVVSVAPQQALLEEIAGDDWRVVCLLANGADPETYDPTSRLRADASRGKAWFRIGALPFEHTLEDDLTAAMPSPTLADSIALIYGTHSHVGQVGQVGQVRQVGHHDDADPHLWTSLRNNRVMATQMLRTLINLDSANADAYTARHRRLDARLDSLDGVIAARLDSGTAIAVWHPSLSYFARDYGLRQISVGMEGKEMSAGQIRHAIDEAKAAGVNAFVLEQSRAGAQTQSVADNIGAPVVTVNLMGTDWEEQLDILSHEIARP